MNKTILVMIFTSVSLGLCNCAGGPTIAGLGAGSDTAYLNASRGRKDAQISRAQAEQYRRQQGLVSDEMDLEHKKKQHFIQNAGGFLGLLQGVGSLAR